MLLLYSGILRGVVRGTSHRGALLCQLCSSSGLLSFEEQSGSWNAGASAHGTPETTVLKTNFPMVMARWRERSYHMFSGPLVYNHRVPFFFLIFPPRLLVVIFFFFCNYLHRYAFCFPSGMEARLWRWQWGLQLAVPAAAVTKSRDRCVESRALNRLGAISAHPATFPPGEFLTSRWHATVLSLSAPFCSHFDPLLCFLFFFFSFRSLAPTPSNERIETGLIVPRATTTRFGSLFVLPETYL